MKNLKILIMLLCLLMGFCTLSFAKAAQRSTNSNKNVKANTIKPEIKKGLKVTPGPFRVQNVTFKLVPLNGKHYLAAAVIFNKNVDKSSFRENNNIRLLRKDAQHFWRDASTQNNKVRIGSNFVTWVSGKPIDNEVYVMHLRGTIKSADGVFLDCNGDGVGEGGNLPAYESKLYQLTIPIKRIDEISEILGDQ
ncbi:MAG: hypothetical protein GY707_02825 [Desulfobacteraceae bacterium]|nr:hypothetical protein [Desulfobacteraceae bacterium]